MNTNDSKSNPIDLICLSHLRWGFVFQRPQHLMSRFARRQRVYFVEEPLFEKTDVAVMRDVACPQTGVVVVTPVIPDVEKGRDVQHVVRHLLNGFMRRENIQRYVAWFYTPMSLEISPDVDPELIVYDCMDELSLFRGAPPKLCENETELFQRANLVFTGGVSLFEAKRNRHAHVYPFPSGVDVEHFAKARSLRKTASEQTSMPKPRIGYAGVIDERLDMELLDEVSRLRPLWQWVMVGPVVKIDPETLPKRDNVHWLGQKNYQELPRYFAGWDAAILPFALNDATRYISPTKTPEYLAAGLPVVSTAIRDVVSPYGNLGLARIARTPDEFVLALEQSMSHGFSMKWRERADQFLQTLSWEDTWSAMARLIDDAILYRNRRPAAAMAAGSSTPRSSGISIAEGRSMGGERGLSV